MGSEDDEDPRQPALISLKNISPLGMIPKRRGWQASFFGNQAEPVVQELLLDSYVFSWLGMSHTSEDP